MERFPDDFVYNEYDVSPISKEKFMEKLLKLKRLRLYSEIKYQELTGAYNYKFCDRLYNIKYLLILLQELNERYPNRFTLSSFKNQKFDKISYSDFINNFSNIPALVTINLCLKNYPTKDSICHFHNNRVDTEQDFNQNHQACLSHGHCLNPISCPLNCDINKEYKKNTGLFIK
jgi:hypothetical protein